MPRYKEVDPNQSFPQLEEKVLERWRDLDLFNKSLELRKDGEPYVFYEGPPTANGRPGSHHVLSRVFKDIFPRYQTMLGRYVPRKAGWDCHGLPVELEVERELGLDSKEAIEEYGIDKFNAKCRESVFKYVEEWNKLTERIGFWIDLDDPYQTLTNNYIESVWWSLKEIWDADRLYKGEKIVPYCARCGTALSSHELALGYKDVEDPSIYVRFSITDPGDSGLGEGDRLLVWTTTPWTLIANTAVAVNPSIDYVVVEHEGERLVVGEPLLAKVFGEEVVPAKTLAGSQLVGIRYEPPFPYLGDLGEQAFQIYGADFVTTEEGTGLVHLAPAFGEDDLSVAREHGLPIENPVKPDGTYDDRVPDFADQFVKDADPAIIENLKERHILLRAETYEHSYPHCWRCDTPLIYYSKSSWYIKTTEVRPQMLAENAKIGWHPEHIRDGRFGKWLENNIDWALSRERYWGTPLPIWECECGAKECVGSLEQLSGQAAGDVPGDLDLHRPYIDEVKLKCEQCGGEMARVEEVIDAWYDSGSMPYAQWHYPFENEELFKQRFPADFICEAIDQTRGWFYSLLAVSTMLFEQSSYKNVLCLGLILDAEGQKMSKSKGNVVIPWDVLDQHGADAFRWYYLTAQAPWSGYRFSMEAVGESVRKFLLTLWNTYSFFVLYANVEDFDPAEHQLPLSDRPEIDRWIISRLNSTTKKVRDRLDNYDSTNAGKAIAELVEDLSNWYVRRSRRRFWRGLDDVSAFLTLHECLVEVSKLLAPFTPFVADEIFTNLTGDESVHLASYPEADEALIDSELEFVMGSVRRTVEIGRAARAKAKAKVRQPLSKAVIVADKEEQAVIERLTGLILDELNVKELSFVTEASELSSYKVKPNFKVLGPRFGKNIQAVKEAVTALDADHVAATLKEGGTVGVVIGGNEETLSVEDLELGLQAREGYVVESEGKYAVALDTELDDELIREGLAREVVHAVQGARKNAGLNVEDRIELAIDGDPDVVEAAKAFGDYIAAEVLATELAFGGDREHVERVSVDGKDLTIGLAKA